jgi:hypothetical protein
VPEIVHPNLAHVGADQRCVVVQADACVVERPAGVWVGEHEVVVLVPRGALVVLIELGHEPRGERDAAL